MLDFTEEQLTRYSRHIILSEIGGKGQQKLKHAKVFCVGAGGLGSPSALYLAAAGVGTIGIADADVVDYSNLQRQILHATSDVDKLKVESAKETLLSINPNTNVVTYETRLTSENVLDIIKDFDIILDGSDNFPTRFLINDACYFAGKTLISGSIYRFEGQLFTSIGDQDYPCYRCLYPEPPPQGLVPSCQEAGVLGVLAGTIGTLQAAETIKEILGIGELLRGRLLIYDALDMIFREVKVPKDPECPLCGVKKITELLDYEISCSI